MNRRYRRIVRQPNSQSQPHQLALVGLGLSLMLLLSLVSIQTPLLFRITARSIPIAVLGTVISGIALYHTWNRRELTSVLEMPSMSRQATKTSLALKGLFSDKAITDILGLSNSTRYGEEMPEIYVWVDDTLSEGFIGIENIANWERADREKFEQRVSGILAGKYQRFAVVSSELTAGDSFIIFHFEDTATSQRLIVSDDTESLKKFINDDKHAIQLSKNLVWHSDIVPHLSIIARTRAGKSVLAGRYMARLMLFQGWEVEYNSAKYDRYVKEFNGQSDPMKIVERAEYWCSIMDKRLAEINEAGKEKYLDMEDMSNIGLFFDELGNLNASLEALDKTDKALKASSRWTTAINRLSATGGSAGVHLITISQFATKGGFLPSLARVNCSDAVIMLGGAADSADERKYLISGYADMPKRSYGKGQGIARILGSGKKWQVPHFYETPWFED